MKKLIFNIFTVAVLSSVLGVNSYSEGIANQPELSLNGHYQVEANWSQLKRGWNTLLIKLTDENQKTVSGAKLTLRYDMAGMAMNPPDKPILDKGNGDYEKQVFIGMNGGWKFELTIEGLNTDTYVRDQKVP